MNSKRLKFAPEGVNYITTAALLFLATVLFYALGRKKFWKWSSILSGAWLLAVVQFFRDPDRIAPENDGTLIASPADGKIIVVEDNPDDNPLDIAVKKISIFMSPVNVHVNRSPVNGTIDSVEHYEGQFKSAFDPAASTVNERTVIKMTTPYGKVAFKQVAGFLARRIVFYPAAGDILTIGQRVGMIKFGSRVDVYVPVSASVNVVVGDIVCAGESIIGVFTNE